MSRNPSDKVPDLMAALKESLSPERCAREGCGQPEKHSVHFGQDEVCPHCSAHLSALSADPEFEGRAGDMGEGHYGDCPFSGQDHWFVRAPALREATTPEYAIGQREYDAMSDQSRAALHEIAKAATAHMRVPASAPAAEERETGANFDARLGIDHADTLQRAARRLMTKEIVRRMCEGDKWRMSIPVHVEDSDILLTAVAEDGLWLEAQLATVTRAAREFLAHVDSSRAVIGSDDDGRLHFNNEFAVHSRCIENLRRALASGGTQP